MIKAIIFDLDGTLIDSLGSHFYSWSKVLKQYKILPKKSEYYINEGESDYIFLKRLSKENNILLNTKKINDLIYQKKMLFKKKFKIKFYRNVISTLNHLKNKNIKLALVSGGSKQRIFDTLPSYFIRKFEFILTRDDYKNPKPNPEPYLKALKILKLAKENCLIIENSPSGIISAKETKIKTVAITNTLPRKYLKNADIIIDSLLELKKIYKET